MLGNLPTLRFGGCFPKFFNSHFKNQTKFKIPFLLKIEDKALSGKIAERPFTLTTHETFCDRLPLPSPLIFFKHSSNHHKRWLTSIWRIYQFYRVRLNFALFLWLTRSNAEAVLLKTCIFRLKNFNSASSVHKCL